MLKPPLSLESTLSLSSPLVGMGLSHCIISFERYRKKVKIMNFEENLCLLASKPCAASTAIRSL